jgi:hypothetical protein
VLGKDAHLRHSFTPAARSTRWPRLDGAGPRALRSYNRDPAAC